MLRRMKGFTLIELLIVVAIIAILAAIAVPNFLEAQTRAKVARVRGDQRTLTIALETFYIDNNQYPVQDSSSQTGRGVNYFGTDPNKPYRMAPTFPIKTGPADNTLTLTTPVSYVSTYFSDPFADTKNVSFSYSQSAYGMGYIIWSYGPDSDENDTSFNQAMAGKYPSGGDIAIKLSNNKPVVDETSYNAAGIVPSTFLLTSSTYDPSNGTSSNGDVYRYKQ